MFISSSTNGTYGSLTSIPIDKALWIVDAPMLKAATPVGAVNNTDTSSGLNKIGARRRDTS